MAAPSSVADTENALSNMLRQWSGLDQRMSETSRLVNASRPVNRLPVELLVTIFRYIHGDPPKHRYDVCFTGYMERKAPWYPMIAVCHYWYTIVCTTPMLWRLVRILPETKPELMELVLSRSKELPIEVDIYFPAKVAPFTQVLLRHCSRISSFHAQDVSRSQASHIYHLVRQPMPTLRTLNMWFDPVLASQTADDDDIADLGIVQEKEVFMLKLSVDFYPELRELSLRGVGLRGLLPCGVYGGSPPNLTHLELRDSTSPYCNIVEFVRFLGDCRRLQFLTIVRFRPSDEGFNTHVGISALDPLPVVGLAPTLRRLVLENIDMYIARLLSGLTVPASTDIRLTKLINIHDGDELRFPEALVEEGFLTVLPTKKTGLPLLSALTSVHICLSDGSAHLVADAGEHSMSFTIKVDPQDCRPNLAPDIHDDMELLTAASDSIVELTVMNVGDLKISDTDFDGLLCSLPKLKILSVFSVRPPAGDDLASLEDELMETAEFHDGCEALEELNLNCLKPSDDEKLIDNLGMWLRHRSSQGMRLKHLRIELAGRGESTNLGDAEQAAREARFVDTLRPLVDAMECAHRILVERTFEVSLS
ncbi:hypothetical protein OH76DRAFT_1409037 [Lentinus brumalis]|uniref:Uncharacterized protein n=1 Tax=Lentinus brumalis TaxID=2498619 RepID=A0A371CW07_9APHY|nr:hypothetical protein OH76DRAFT_1409037 [Polyporus brumalis]